MIFKELIKEKKITFIIGALASILLVSLAITKPQSNPEDVKVSLISHFETNVGVWAEVIGSQKRTQISIPFSFDKEPLDVWLNYQIAIGKHVEYLMFHPQLQTISWDVIRQGNISLYQKQVEFESVDEFIKNPKGVVFADPQIVLKYPEKDFQSITLDMDLDNIDYILTTFSPVPQKYGTFYFEKIIDTSDAYIDEDNKMFWLVYVPRANQERTYNLGNIDVVYLQ